MLYVTLHTIIIMIIYLTKFGYFDVSGMELQGDFHNFLLIINLNVVQKTEFIFYE